MDIENLLKTIQEMLEENGLEYASEYEISSNTKGMDIIIDKKRFDIRIIEK